MSQAETTPGIGALLGGLASDVQKLVKGEIALAKTELDSKLDRVTTAATSAIGGALVFFAGFIVVLFGIAYGVAYVVPIWLAFLIVGAVVVILGAVLTRNGLSKFSSTSLVPKRTAANLSKDATMLKEHL